MNRNTITDPKIENLIGKMQKVADDLAGVWGAFAVFGLLESEDTPGRLDVIASFPGLPQGRDGIVAIADTILEYLTSSEAILLGSIILLPENSDLVRALTRLAPDVSSGYAPVGGFIIDGRLIDNGYILASYNNPPSRKPVGAAG